MTSSKILTRDAESDLINEKNLLLIKKIKQNDKEALKELILSNHGLVLSRYYKLNFIPSSSFDKEDAIQEGIIGLIKAAYKFDETKGFKFSTYAMTAIERRLKDEIARQAYYFKFARKTVYKIFQIRGAFYDYYYAKGEFPTEQQLADSLNMKLEKLQSYKARFNAVMSLNTKVDESKDGEEYINIIPSKEDDLDTQIIMNEVRNNLENALSHLSKKEKQAINLVIFNKMSYRDAAEKVGRSHTYVKNHHDKALVKLRSILINKY
jgi:RNA polymerase sigma factor (sigma-70 family)